MMFDNHNAQPIPMQQKLAKRGVIRCRLPEMQHFDYDAVVILLEVIA